MSGEEPMMQGDTRRSNKQEERIFVSVRLRPLNEKEIARNDVSDWECINRNTITFKHTSPDRAMFPTSYTFDRVFGSDISTKQVYEEGGKDVALSAVSGINSSIFAYGQTSSGKTYTMSGITECAVADIYNYIEIHKEREFILKFSAMEIYNEAVTDLLQSENVPLRLLDDPEKGTVVERLTEVTLRDREHLQKLLSICEAERKIGETSLNEMSSRSHQILRLTIESYAREFVGAGNSSTLLATLHFVDLAGSERASQTSSAGARLKEGSHINRSLLTLGTVIRKLSKGGNGHIPYRDSKLTRILHNSLGGNARTAIICTMSPARSYVEQSRNTLLFASCAKQVTTNAQVNEVMSDKAMVKQLQRELAKMENELKTWVTNSIEYDFVALLKEKDLMIEKMGRKIEELTRQREFTQYHIESRQQLDGGDQFLGIEECAISDPTDPLCLDLSPPKSCRSKDLHKHGVHNFNKHYLQFSENLEDNLLLDDSTPQFVGPDPYLSWEAFAERADEASEDSCKEVRCIEDVSQMDQEEQVGRLTLGEINEDTLRYPQEEPMEIYPQKEPTEAINALIYPEKEPTEATNAVIYPEKEPTEATNAVIYPDKEPTEATNALIYPQMEPMEATNTLTYPQKEPMEATNEDASTPEQKESEETVNEHAMSSPQNRPEDVMNEDAAFCPEKLAEDRNDGNEDSTYDDLKQRIQSMHKAINRLISFCPSDQSPTYEAYLSSTKSLKLARSRSCRAGLVTMHPAYWLEKVDRNDNTPPAGFEKDFPSIPAGPKKCLSASKFDARTEKLSRKSSPSSNGSAYTEGQYTDTSGSKDASSILNFTRDEAANLQSNGEFNDSAKNGDPRTYEHSNNGKDAGMDEEQGALPPGSNWIVKFERQRKEIVELWDVCNVPLAHRTYFFLLFKGEPSDSVYMEVELRRLSFLRDTFSHGTRISKEIKSLKPASSAKALDRERKILSRGVQKLSRKERECLYQKWGIPLNTRRRSLQLALSLWKHPNDVEHVKESAALVAKLMGLEETGPTPKETFGLNFLAPPRNKRYSRWKRALSRVL